MDFDGNSTIKDELLVAALGNPNVDITIKLKDDSLFRKYNLEYDRAKPVDDEFLKNIENDFKKLSPEIVRTPGGCSQNTLRIFQWLMNSKFNSVIIGATGVDEEADFLKQELHKSGVLTHYTPKRDYHTAFVYIFVYDDRLTPVYGTTSAASWTYSVADLTSDEKALRAIRDSKCVIFEGFFVVHGDRVGREAMRMCAEYGTLMAFNICGAYVPKLYANVVCAYVKRCHIVIGNRIEFEAVCDNLKVRHSEENFERALIDVFEMMTEGCDEGGCCYGCKVESMKQHRKILIVTNGPQPIYCVSGDNRLIRYDVPNVDADSFKDATGAGDSFLAGLLYGVLHDFPIRRCLQYATKVAAEILQQHGCVVPQKNPSALLDK